MKILYVIFSLFICTVAVGQNSKKFYFKKIRWTLELPKDYIVSDSSASSDILHEGLDIVNDKSNIQIDTSGTIVLIVANKDENYFSAVITPFNSKINNWNVEHENLKVNSFNLMKETVPNATIDTSSSKIKIDNLLFECFKIKITVEGKLISTVIALSKLYNGYDFGITYAYNSDLVKDSIEQMLMKSKFAR